MNMLHALHVAFQGGHGFSRFTHSAALWEGFIHVWVLRSEGRFEPEI